ncbi:DUF6538 domain-containing protein [Nitratireductor sp. CH_MIT9313-5]|uniref:DUF6538 domain-containing protein n=1 Tax=Nitratireductor sp. CH_MIT9313-5 TaxID=3107764 RepID=UPI00300A12F4
MACASYLSRRDGRYYLQVRLGRTPARLLGKQLYRVSLRTSNYREARIRLSEHLGWIHRMNDSIDYVSLFQKNVRELEAYLQDPWPLSPERLQARQNYEELLKNLNRRAQAANCDPTMIEPDFIDLLNLFVRQNVDAESHLRQQEKVEAYERGRRETLHAQAHASVPKSFRRTRPAPTAASHHSVASHTSPQPAPAPAPVELENPERANVHAPANVSAGKSLRHYTSRDTSAARHSSNGPDKAPETSAD